MSFALACPQCRSPLAETASGYRCPTHGDYARDARGFINFLGPRDDYFADHWAAHQLPEIPPSKRATAAAFLAPLIERLSHGTVVDVGTGDGVHLHYLREAAPQLHCAGLDISASGLATTHQRRPDALLMQADAQAIPLADASVDAAVSYGVLAYVPDPWRGLAEMVRITKHGGLIGLWMYPNMRGLLGLLFRLTRATVTRLPRFLQHRVADMIVPFLRWLPVNSGIHTGNARWAACREVVLVNIAPPQLIFPTRAEIVAQLESLGCRVVAENTSAPITLWAVKEAA